MSSVNPVAARRYPRKAAAAAELAAGLAHPLDGSVGIMLDTGQLRCADAILGGLLILWPGLERIQLAPHVIDHRLRVRHELTLFNGQRPEAAPQRVRTGRFVGRLLLVD